jgi:hypothetical protein
MTHLNTAGDLLDFVVRMRQGGRPRGAHSAAGPVIGIEPTAVLDSLFAEAKQCSPRHREQQKTVAWDRRKQRLAGLNNRPDFMFDAGWQTITENDAVSPVSPKTGGRTIETGR